ncbi:GNAT family N-acetyltransferase [Halohasta litorea]|uniref:GNAT family N-acetyltransferase n=1 Tax=Halohasta litorea TaxID=869891 RepID=A0ABD6D7Z8_9EURY|nr:GNAT family N-acetyltransferase [Halohasta litorea]
MTPSIRQADPDDLVGVMRLFDGALLETDSDRVSDQLTGRRGCLLIAGEERPVGAVGLIDGREIEADLPWPETGYISAIAVRKERRGQGLGRSLIAAAADRAAPRPLSATFDERVRSFYTACGFEIQEHRGRLWGRRPSDGVD